MESQNEESRRLAEALEEFRDVGLPVLWNPSRGGLAKKHQNGIDKLGLLTVLIEHARAGKQANTQELMSIMETRFGYRSKRTTNATASIRMSLERLGYYADRWMLFAQKPYTLIINRDGSTSLEPMPGRSLPEAMRALMHDIPRASANLVIEIGGVPSFGDNGPSLDLEKARTLFGAQWAFDLLSKEGQKELAELIY